MSKREKVIIDALTSEIGRLRNELAAMVRVAKMEFSKKQKARIKQ